MPDPYDSNIDEEAAVRFDQSMPPRGLALAERVMELRNDRNDPDELVFRQETNIPGGNSPGEAGVMNANPVQVVGPPGNGVWIEVLDIQVSYLFDSGTPYDGSGTIDVNVESGGDTVIAQIGSPTMNAASIDHRPGIGYALADNQGLEISTSGDWFSSAGDTPVRVVVRFRKRNF